MGDIAVVALVGLAASNNLELAGNRPEQNAEVLTNLRHRGDDDHRDESSQNAVLHRGHTALVTLELVECGVDTTPKCASVSECIRDDHIKYSRVGSVSGAGFASIL